MKASIIVMASPLSQCRSVKSGDIKMAVGAVGGDNNMVGPIPVVTLTPTGNTSAAFGPEFKMLIKAQDMEESVNEFQLLRRASQFHGISPAAYMEMSLQGWFGTFGYIFMELVPGRDLTHLEEENVRWVDDRPMWAARARSPINYMIIAQFLHQVAVLAELQIVHSDFKTDNWILTPWEPCFEAYKASNAFDWVANKCRILLLDYGLACRADGEDGPCRDWRGSLPYMPPEMLASGPLHEEESGGPAGDVWSLGVVILSLLGWWGNSDFDARWASITELWRDSLPESGRFMLPQPDMSASVPEKILRVLQGSLRLWPNQRAPAGQIFSDFHWEAGDGFDELPKMLGLDGGEPALPTELAEDLDAVLREEAAAEADVPAARAYQIYAKVLDKHHLRTRMKMPTILREELDAQRDKTTHCSIKQTIAEGALSLYEWCKAD